MARVTATEVKAIMNNCTAEDETVNVFINSATLFIDDIFSGVSITEEKLTELERWFTAHMLASTICRTATKETVGDASIDYTGKFGENLSSTPYGQMVKQLDTTGKIASAGKQAIKVYAIKSYD